MDSTTKFYNFRQNNSGGHFKINENLDVNVIIEAVDADQANLRAEDIGIYFDGCLEGIDCSCCGDRWNMVDEYDAEELPSFYGEVIKDFQIEKSFRSDSGICGKIHYLDGTIKQVTYKED